MPPKRAKRKTSSKSKQAASEKQGSAPATKPTDADILSAFSLFAVPRDELDEDANVGEDSEDEEGGEDEDVIPIRDVRKCLTALKLPKPPPDFFPSSQTHVGNTHFLLLAQTLRDSAVDDSDAHSDDADNGEDTEEAAEAFALFTHKRSVSASDTRITLADLKRVARELREDVNENVLKMMIEDANGGDFSKGVTMDEFEAIMRRAGMLR